MSKKHKTRWQPYMTRPLIYKVFTRLGLGLLAVAVVDRVRAAEGSISIWAMGCSLMAALFALGAWMVYLRQDGTHIPRLKSFRPKRKKAPARFYGDMADYVDEEIVDFDDLEDEEKDRVSFLTNILCALLFLILSLF